MQRFVRRRPWQFLCLAALLAPVLLRAQPNGTAPLITDILHRQTVSLDGSWHGLPDPFSTGYSERRPGSPGFFLNKKPRDPSGLVEYNFDAAPLLRVPGDWNNQSSQLLYYEGVLWYYRKFWYHPSPGRRVFLYFGAVNAEAVVGLNGQVLGRHRGGYTPFDFEVTGKLRDGENFVIVRVDNSRRSEDVPSVNFDWWNYGGITRPVYLVETPATFIRDASVQLKDAATGRIDGWVQLDGPGREAGVTVAIPELGQRLRCHADSSGLARFSLSAKHLTLWDPAHPKLYRVTFTAGADTLSDDIGFRTVAVRGTDILLNGKPVFLRGVCVQGEAAFGGGRAYAAAQDRVLIGWAKQLGCNFLRLVHYPHAETMIREAEKAGLLVWSEIPVYWDVQWENPATLETAEQQLTEEITRDRNRAAVILWSIGNETPTTPERLTFMRTLVEKAHALDSTRLVTAALKATSGGSVLNDPLGRYLDVVGLNVYPGWYGPSAPPDYTLQMAYSKPLIMSEFGAGAVAGRHGSDQERWTEEFQRRVLTEDIRMLRRIGPLRGTAPWVLKDFRSPKRLLSGIQDGWNLKGLVSDNGEKKEAFFTIRDFYQAILRDSIRFGTR